MSDGPGGAIAFPCMPFDSITDVAIVGAGPYGLSLASHLTARGVPHRIFGQPMSTWRGMLPGMSLTSLDASSSIAAPEPGYGFVDYCRAHGRDSGAPCPLALFTEYGLWVQEQLVPELERCAVARVGLRGVAFQLELETGEVLRARRVVMATGLTHARRLPDAVAGLPQELVTHTGQHRDLARFRGMDVTVVGAGQSALEAAALLHESGAVTRLLVRGAGVRFAPPPGPRPLHHRVAHPMSVLGPGRLNLLLERVPAGAHLLLSEQRRVRLTRGRPGPGGAWWLRERVEGAVAVHPRSEVVDAVPVGTRLSLGIRQQGEADRRIETDHLLCGTGYEVDVDMMPMLEPALSRRIRRVERAPRLDRHYESSVMGLHFVGAASALSFGPLVHLVAGTAYTAPALARRLARTTGSVTAPAPHPAVVADGRAAL
ncbi:MAG: hypothetical protein QOG45_1216 [Chloroflexota bacterium]|nr:hypothetical protein [Chloroflexota bacterium]